MTIFDFKKKLFEEKEKLEVELKSLNIKYLISEYGFFIIHKDIKDPQLKKEIEKYNENFFYQEENNKKIYWVELFDKIGSLCITFDKIKVYNLWEDYPHNFTKEEIEILKKEEVYWSKFFGNRVVKV